MRKKRYLAHERREHPAVEIYEKMKDEGCGCHDSWKKRRRIDRY